MGDLGPAPSAVRLPRGFCGMGRSSGLGYSLEWGGCCLNYSRGGGPQLLTCRSVFPRFTLASHFFWGLWSILQAKISTIEFGYLVSLASSPSSVSSSRE